MIERLREYLDTHDIKYETILHSPAYTAQEIAAAARIPGREVVKTVMVRVDGVMVMTAVPASHYVDFERLKESVGALEVQLANESDYRDLFPDCDIGAEPPFGNLYGLDVYVAKPLIQDRYIAFNAGSYRELVRMTYTDYERLVKPRVFSFTQKETGIPREERPVHA